MDAAPMVNRCLELQNDNIPAPYIHIAMEEIPDHYRTGVTISEHCERCGVNHGSGTVYEYPTHPAE